MLIYIGKGVLKDTVWVYIIARDKTSVRYPGFTVDILLLLKCAGTCGPTAENEERRKKSGELDIYR